MLFELADWVMQVDVEMTRAHTRANAADHCGCAYCKNYYEMLPATYPGLCVALNRMGIDPMGPSELMPFTPTVYLACYRVCGTIEKWGTSALAAEGVLVVPERAEEEGSFFPGRSFPRRICRNSWSEWGKCGGFCMNRRIFALRI